jgi:hypothetical protein
MLPVWSPWYQSQSCRFLNPARVLTITIAALCYPVSNRFMQDQHDVAIAKSGTRCGHPAMYFITRYACRSIVRFPHTVRYVSSYGPPPCLRPHLTNTISSHLVVLLAYSRILCDPEQSEMGLYVMTDQHATPHSDYITEYCSAVCTWYVMNAFGVPCGVFRFS